MSRISKDLEAHRSQSSLPLSTPSDHDRIDGSMPRVAVIGAGFSGLRCAEVLLRSGLNVTVFEARNRVGGRVHQQKFNGHTFDMGANWIHGTEGNPIMDMAEAIGATIMKPDEESMIVDSSGRRMSKEKSTEISAETWATVAQAFKYSNEHLDEIDPQRSLMDYFRVEVPKRFPNDKQKIEAILEEAKTWGPFIGDATDRQSLRNFFLEECLEGENVYLASTYADILAQVSRKAIDEGVINFNEEIVKVDYRSAEVPSRAGVVLTSAAGDQSEFDEVVVTCPLGWLKRHKERMFSPALPPHLSQAIDNISYGHLEKIWAKFPRAWWMDGSSPTEAPNNDVDTSTPIFTHFHHPHYHPDPVSKTNEFWNQSVVSMAHFPPPTDEPTLLFYYYSPCSLYMTTKLKTSEPGSEEYNAIIWKFLEPFVSRLPSYSASKPECSPTILAATQWANDPFAGHGSYSNFQVGLVDGEKDIICMRNAGGLSDKGRGLWLAGEHTAPFVALGTTTGAYWSGESVARRILGRYGIKEVKVEEDRNHSVVINGVSVGGTVPVLGDQLKKTVDAHEADGANLNGVAI